jgi:hypothetical protein
VSYLVQMYKRHSAHLSLVLNLLNPCPVCGAESALAEIQPHPVHVNLEIHGYLCDRCGPIKSNPWLYLARGARGLYIDLISSQYGDMRIRQSGRA